MTDDQYIIATLADLAAGQSAIVVLHDGKRCLVTISPGAWTMAMSIIM
jgi:hypothetical protein